MLWVIHIPFKMRDILEKTILAVGWGLDWSRTKLQSGRPGKRLLKGQAGRPRDLEKAAAMGIEVNAFRNTRNRACGWIYWLRSQSGVQKDSEICHRHWLHGGAGCWNRDSQRRGRVRQGRGGGIPWTLSSPDSIVKKVKYVFYRIVPPSPTT